MARTKTPKSWEIVSALQTHNDRRPYPKKLDELLETYTLYELQRREERILYRMGYIRIPRALLEDPRYIALRPGSKSVFIWLMIKAEIIRKKQAAGIEDEETRRLPWITATGKEIQFYAGIRSKGGTRHISEHTAALQAAGLIDIKEARTGARIEAKLYRIQPLEYDHKGYIKAPIKIFLTPQHIRLSHTAKALYLVFLSQHQTAQHATGDPFPLFSIPYSVIKRYGVKGYKTISDGITELEQHQLITITRGQFYHINDTEGTRNPNSYSITTAGLYAP